MNDANGDARLHIACGPRDDYGNRLVVAAYGGCDWRDTFATEFDWRREKFARRAVDKLKLGEEWLDSIEDKIIAASDAVDAQEQSKD